MTKSKRRRFSAIRWLRNEAQAMEDSYGNTPREAVAFVLDILKEGMYDDELSYSQAMSAIAACHKEIERLDK